MKRCSLRQIFAAGAAVIAAAFLLPGDAIAQRQLPPGEGHRASVAEATQLPKFCWAQYMDVKGPEFYIAGCGVGMNHYCWGLVELLRANRSFGDTRLRVGYLRAARGNTLYTINWMNQSAPNCWLRPHVENTHKQIESQLRIYGVK